MNVEPRMPTQVDGRHLHNREWSGEVQAYLTVHNLHIRTTWMSPQGTYVTDDVQYSNTHRHAHTHTQSEQK
eukprot:5551248-Amphidinium_carterae.1